MQNHKVKEATSQSPRCDAAIQTVRSGGECNRTSPAATAQTKTTAQKVSHISARVALPALCSKFLRFFELGLKEKAITSKDLNYKSGLQRDSKSQNGKSCGF